MTDDLPTLSAALTGRYRHNMGREYEVLDVAWRSETPERLVIYPRATDLATTPQGQPFQREPLPRDCRLDTWAQVRQWALLAGSLGVLTPP